MIPLSKKKGFLVIILVAMSTVFSYLLVSDSAYLELGIFDMNNNKLLRSLHPGIIGSSDLYNQLISHQFNVDIRASKQNDSTEVSKTVLNIATTATSIPTLIKTKKLLKEEGLGFNIIIIKKITRRTNGTRFTHNNLLLFNY